MDSPFFYNGNFGQNLKNLIFIFHRQDYTPNPLIFVREKRCNCLFLGITIVEAKYGSDPFWKVEVLDKNLDKIKSFVRYLVLKECLYCIPMHSSLTLLFILQITISLV